MFKAHFIHYTHKVNSDGTSPIIIQIQKKRRTLANVLPSQWDGEQVKPRSHPHYAAINKKILNEKNRIGNLIYENKFDLQRDFIDYFDNLKTGNTTPQKDKKTILDIIPLYISSLKSGHSMIAYEARLKYFAREAGVEHLSLSEIKKEHMDRFMSYMVGKGNMRSTMRTQLKIIRYLSSFAESAGIYPKNPVLHNFKLPIAERSFKTKLNTNEWETFKKYEVDTPLKQEVKDMFMLAVYFRGMRIGDVIQLKQEYFKNGRFIYESGKNKKQFNIKLTPDAAQIVNKYLDGREYLFTLFKYKTKEHLSAEDNLKNRAKEVQSITTVVNKTLKNIGGDAKIKTNISSHIGRHTFAKMAIEKVKDFNLSMDLIGHSNIKEHQLYIREISETEDLDKAADDIFS